jgi:hypothetical protein
LRGLAGKARSGIDGAHRHALPCAEAERRTEPAVSEAEGRPAPRLAECRSQPEILKIAYTPATGALNGSTMTAGARWRTPYRPAPRCI